MRKAFGNVRSSGTFPATGVMASIFSSGERMASNSARASSTPGSVSMMTRNGLRPEPGPDFPSDLPCADGCPGGAPPVLVPKANPLVAKTAADEVTNWRRVMQENSCFEPTCALLLKFRLESRLAWLFRGPRRLRHQFDIEIVQLLCVHIELNGRNSLVRRKLRACLPEERFTVAWPVVNIDIHVELLLSGDDRRIDQGSRGEFIPHKTFDRVLRQVASDRRIRFGDSRSDGWVHQRLDGNVDGRDRDLFPGRAHRYPDSFRIKPPVKFAPSINARDAAVVGVHPAAHQDQLFRERRHFWIKPQGEGNVGQRAAGPHHHFARILAYHADDEAGSSFVESFDVRSPLHQRRNHVGIVISLAKRRRRTFRALGKNAPTAFIAELPVESLPAFRLFLGIQQRELRALRDGNISAARDFKQSQRALRFFLYPLIAAYGGNAQNVKLIRLEENQDGLHVGCGRTPRVLIDDDLDFLCQHVVGEREQQKSNQQQNDASSLHGLDSLNN